jgi:hypothetical protein
MIIDFTEIPQANLGGGLQDTFELFTRDFLEDLGFEIIQHPDRGPDGKKDLIVGEVRSGVGGKTSVRWLVSCKHFAHSGKSVSDTDEPDITDRVAAHKCQGFIGVYSTIPATSLNVKLNGYGDKICHQVYDRERIEKELLKHPLGIKLSRRYFPLSIDKFIVQNPKPVKIFNETTVINCEYCNKDLLTTKNGIFVLLSNPNEEKTSKSGHKYNEEKYVYFSCKGECDMRLEAKYRSKGLWNAGWEDIDDLMIPTLFLKNIMAYVNQLTDQDVSKETHEKMKQLYIRVFPHIVRELTDEEKERVKTIVQFGI